MCKRGLTRDACPGEAITRRAAGAGHERRPERPRYLFLSSTSPSCLLHRTRVPCPRSCAPTSFIRAPKSPSGGVEPPRRLNLPASASNLGPHIPPSPLWAPLSPPRISSSCCCSPYVSPRKRKRKTERVHQEKNSPPLCVYAVHILQLVATLRRVYILFPTPPSPFRLVRAVARRPLPLLAFFPPRCPALVDYSSGSTRTATGHYDYAA